MRQVEIGCKLHFAIAHTFVFLHKKKHDNNHYRHYRQKMWQGSLLHCDAKDTILFEYPISLNCEY